MRIISIEDGKVLVHYLTDPSRIPEGAFKYAGDWPDSNNLLWDEEAQRVVADAKKDQEDLKKTYDKKRIEDEKKSSRFKGMTVDETFSYIDSQIDLSFTVQDNLDAIKRILKEIVPFILK